MRVLPELAGMEWRGVSLDRGRLEHLGRCLARQLEAIEGQAHGAAGRQFNLCSPAQVRSLPIIARP
jgi:DNA polymerase-1